eukprot:5466169-Pyramimonas_sp.AAC.1
MADFRLSDVSGRWRLNTCRGEEIVNARLASSVARQATHNAASAHRFHERGGTGTLSKLHRQRSRQAHGTYHVLNGLRSHYLRTG